MVAALVVLAFSLRGAPPALDPATGTIEFDAAGARAAARAILAAAPTREPGSEGDAAAAALVRERFEAIGTGTVGEQRFEASVDGNDEELRNVLLTLPGASDRAVVVSAGRDSRGGSGAATSAAATGVMLELAAQLGIADRELSLVFASTDAASSEAQGIEELVDGLPERIEVEVVVSIGQPGTADLQPPYVIDSSAGSRRPTLQLLGTAEQALADRAQLEASSDGPFGQIARLALPAAAGEQAAMNERGYDAVTLSAAGEVPLGPVDAAADDLDIDSLRRIGAAALALVGAIDANAAGLEPSPEGYVRLGDSVIPGWALGLLALALLVPPALVVASALIGGRAGEIGSAIAGVGRRAIVLLAALAAIYALALLGLVPRSGNPYDPGRWGIGPLEVVALILLLGSAAAAVRLAHPGYADADTGTQVIAGASVTIAACLLAWLANPFLALVAAPLAHVVVARAPGRNGHVLAAVGTALALIPLAATLVHVGATLDWGLTTPWQLVVLLGGGGLGFIPAFALALALAGTSTVTRPARVRAPRNRLGDDPNRAWTGRLSDVRPD